MKMVVTGGLGFIGSNFISSMLDGGNAVEIVNVDKLSFGSNAKNLEAYSTNPRYSFVQGYISDLNLMKKLVDGADYVVNFAAESHVDRSIADSRPFLKSNVEGV